MKKLILVPTLLAMVACKLPKESDQYGDGVSLFSIDGSGLRKIAGVTSTRAAGSYAVENNYVPTRAAVPHGLQLQGGGSSIAEINQRCGLREGMTVVMALSYLDGQTTGQLGGKAVACKSMRGDVYQSIEWQDGEICFSPQNNTTTQLVRAPGHTDGAASLMSLTEYCENYTDFFLSMQQPQGFGLNTAALAEIPDADTLYRGGLEAAQGSVSISLAGSSLNFSGRNSFVLTHAEGSSGAKANNGLYLQGESYNKGAVVKAYHEGQVGFRGFTFSEQGKGNMMAGEPYTPQDFQNSGTLPNSPEQQYGSQFSDPSSFALQGAPTPQDLGLQPDNSGSFSGDRDLQGGEFQIFWQ